VRTEKSGVLKNEERRKAGDSESVSNRAISESAKLDAHANTQTHAHTPTQALTCFLLCSFLCAHMGVK